MKVLHAGEVAGIGQSLGRSPILKNPINANEVNMVRRHHECLVRLSSHGVAPKSMLSPMREYGLSLNEDPFWPEEDLGTSEVVTMDGEVKFQRGCVALLNALAMAGIRHGDLTRHNIIVRDGVPMAIDFHESQLEGETGDPKRPEGDAYWLWHAAEELSPDTTRRIRRWRAIRPFLQHGETLIDWGCAEGDFIAMVEAEHKNINAHGYDNNYELVEALKHIRNLSFADITEMKDYRCDTAFFMSVLPHIKRKSGTRVAMETLRNIVDGSRQCFFETQLFGDGPGLGTHKTDEDVFEMLLGMFSTARGGSKYVDRIVTIPVYGRNTHRTVWRIYTP